MQRVAAMEYASPQTDRRKYQRYQLPDLVIAIPNNPEPHVARIVNVSKGGMAVRYIDQDNWLGKAEKINIFVSSNFSIKSLPIKCVRDFNISDHVSFSIIQERQCCLQFTNLTPTQESMLDEFIMKCTAGTS